jgi:ABC-type multidrug transport system fused ATPase/permease subunit
MQLASRFYDPLAGSVTLDGIPLNELNVSSFRSCISLVSQEPTLYSGTIRENICLVRHPLSFRCDLRDVELILSLPFVTSGRHQARR